MTGNSMTSQLSNARQITFCFIKKDKHLQINNFSNCQREKDERAKGRICFKNDLAAKATREHRRTPKAD